MKNIIWKDWCWSWNSNTLATWCEELTHWERPWCWERLKAGGEGDDRGWGDEGGWMASLTRWTWVWVSSGSWWWTEKPGVKQSMGSQRVKHDWAIELKWMRNKVLYLSWQEILLVCIMFLQFSSVQFSHVWLFATPWITAHQASLSRVQQIKQQFSFISQIPCKWKSRFGHYGILHPIILSFTIKEA